MRVNVQSEGISKKAVITLGLISLFPIFYTLVNRRFETVFLGTFFMFLTIMGITIVSFLFIYLNDRSIKFRKENFLSLTLVILYLGFVFHTGIETLKDFSNYKSLKFHGLERDWLSPAYSFGILLIGVLFFYFRLLLRVIYGLAEVIVGIVIGTDKVLENFEQLSSSKLYLIILTASIYLIVRGLDNIHQGLTKEPYDFIVAKLIR